MAKINYWDIQEKQYRKGQKDILDKVEEYLSERMQEWCNLDDRKYELPNIQVYNSLRTCMNDLHNLYENLGDYKAEPNGWWVANNICSNCHKNLDGYAYQREYLYCPFCGTRME